MPLIQLSHTKPSLTVVAPPMSLETIAEPSWLLYRRLCCLERSLSWVNMTVKLLTPGPDIDNCLVQQFQEQVGHLRAELSNVAGDILSLEQEDQSLLEQE